MPVDERFGPVPTHRDAIQLRVEALNLSDASKRADDDGTLRRNPPNPSGPNDDSWRDEKLAEIAQKTAKFQAGESAAKEIRDHLLSQAEAERLRKEGREHCQEHCRLIDLFQVRNLRLRNCGKRRARWRDHFSLPHR